MDTADTSTDLLGCYVVLFGITVDLAVACMLGSSVSQYAVGGRACSAIRSRARSTHRKRVRAGVCSGWWQWGVHKWEVVRLEQHLQQNKMVTTRRC